jgi:ElaB/YqjD/DUF883 family membrane-anchored ribosome-binding protein
MAENETAKPPFDSPETKPVETPAQDAEQTPELSCAAAAVRCAEAELKKARDLYGKARRKAADRLKAVREKSLGDVIDGTLGLVKKHPGCGVICATLLGFFLGRLFKR